MPCINNYKENILQKYEFRVIYYTYMYRVCKITLASYIFCDACPSASTQLSRRNHLLPASVAQLDACPTGDQEVAGSTLCWDSNILSWRFDHEIFFMVILSLPLVQEGQLSVSGKRMCTILVTSLED